MLLDGLQPSRGYAGIIPTYTRQKPIATLTSIIRGLWGPVWRSSPLCRRDSCFKYMAPCGRYEGYKTMSAQKFKLGKAERDILFVAVAVRALVLLQRLSEEIGDLDSMGYFERYYKDFYRLIYSMERFYPVK